MLRDAKAMNSFAVDDIGRAREFYEDRLGVSTTVLDEQNGLMALQLSGGRETLVYEKPDFEPAGYTILNFAVEDVERAVDELAAAGVSFERYEGFEQDEKGISRGDGPDIAWFSDPAGNILAVLEEAAEAQGAA